MLRFAIAGLAGFVLLAGPGAAAPAQYGVPVQRTIAMTGTGTGSAMPDRANVYAGVVTDRRTASQAMDANRGVMNRVFDAVTALGIPKSAIQTSSFSLDPHY